MCVGCIVCIKTAIRKFGLEFLSFEEIVGNVCWLHCVQAGFLTPVSLHYVRNHGAVPRASWDDWRIDVGGLVKRPTTLKMNDILRLPAHELPVTLVCAGNRRKEENMVKQSIGFNWGAAAVSTSIWKGVHLCDVLRLCGVKSRKRGALYVCFEGAEILPGTSIHSFLPSFDEFKG
jgi:nitrate reductase (NAD(P)H)